MSARRILATAGGVLTLAAVPVAASPGSGAAVFRVRPDLRLCPSPACGGLWVALVNRSVTACPDGTVRAWCYVAGVGLPPSLSGARWSQLQPLLAPGQVLVEGRFVAREGTGLPSLWLLSVSAAWRSAAGFRQSGTVWLVRDTGRRCFAAPCFSLHATAVNGSASAELSQIELAGTGASRAALLAAQRALGAGGILAAGTVRRVPHAGPAGAGRTLTASRFWLRVTEAG